MKHPAVPRNCASRNLACHDDPVRDGRSGGRASQDRRRATTKWWRLTVGEEPGGLCVVCQQVADARLGVGRLASGHCAW